MKRLHAPPSLDELAGEPIKQFRMNRTLSKLAEIVFRPGQAFPEVMLPDSVNHHPRGERILRISDPLRKLTPPAAFLDRRLRRGQQRRKTARNDFAQPVIPASLMNF